MSPMEIEHSAAVPPATLNLVNACGDKERLQCKGRLSAASRLFMPQARQQMVKPKRTCTPCNDCERHASPGQMTPRSA